MKAYRLWAKKIVLYTHISGMVCRHSYRKVQYSMHVLSTYYKLRERVGQSCIKYSTSKYQYKYQY